jgi:uncharacterized membrane protein
MRRTVEVRHIVFIAAPVDAVKAQFADLHHHIEANVHPNLRFEVLAQEPRRARFTQQAKLLGMWQRDVIDRTIDDDGTIHDVSVDGFNKGATLDFRFTPKAEGGRPGTEVDVTIRLQTPPLLGFLAPLLARQVRTEVTTAAEQDKRDIEGGYRPSAAHATA